MGSFAQDNNQDFSDNDVIALKENDNSRRRLISYLGGSDGSFDMISRPRPDNDSRIVTVDTGRDFFGTRKN